MSMNKIMQNVLDDKIQPLDNEFEIEEAIRFIHKIDKELDWLKGYKKYQADKISKNIDDLSGKKEKLKAIISATMEKSDKKTLSFPGIGKVSLKDNKGKWDIKDQDSLVGFLQKELSEDAFDEVVEKSIKISKKNLNTILNKWEKVDKVPDSVQREEGSKSVAVTFDKSIEQIDADFVFEADSGDVQSYDSLDPLSVKL